MELEKINEIINNSFNKIKLAESDEEVKEILKDLYYSYLSYDVKPINILISDWTPNLDCTVPPLTISYEIIKK